MSIREDIAMLRAVELFAAADPAHLQVLVFAAPRVEVAAGGWLFREGQVDGAGWLLRSGAASAWRTEKGQERKIANLGRGAFTGELAMAARQPHHLSVKAETRLSALRFDHDLFLRVAAEFPEFGRQVFAVLTRRLELSMLELNRVRELFVRTRSFN